MRILTASIFTLLLISPFGSLAQPEIDSALQIQIPTSFENDRGFYFEDCAHGHICCNVGCGCCEETPTLVSDTLELDLGDGRRLVGSRQQLTYSTTRASSMQGHELISEGYNRDTLTDSKALRNYGQRWRYQFSIVNESGDAIVKVPFQSISSHEGYYYVRVNGLFGIMDSDLHWIKTPRYKEEIPQWFYNKESSGLLTVSENGKYGLIDKAGEIILPFEHEKIQMSGPHAKTENEGKYSLFDLEKKEFIIGPYQDIAHLYDEKSKKHYYKVQDESGQYGLVDQDGKTKLKINYESIELKRLWLVEKGGKKGVFDEDFSSFLPITYDSIVMYQTILVKKNSLWGVYNYKGKMLSECALLLPPRQYNGFILCRDANGQGAGAIRTHVVGETDFIPPTYSIISPIFPRRKEGKYYCIVRHGVGGYGVLEANKNVLVIPEEYDEVKTKKYFHGNTSNVARTDIYLRKGDLWALFEEGKELEFTITNISEETNKNFQYRTGVRTVIYFWK